MASEKTVTIAGGGIFGLSCAWELTRRGAAIRLFEAQHIGAGSSGGTVGALAPHAPENWNDKKQLQLDALEGAADWWAGVAAAGGVDPGYGRTGRLQPLAAVTLPRIHDRIAAARQNWPEWARLEILDSPDAPLIPASPDGLWLFDNLTARLNPRRALAALTAALRASGAEVIEGMPAPTDTMIWATGAQGLAEFGGNGVKGQSALLRFDARGAPQVFAEALHIVPHGDGTVAIGSTSEREFDGLGTDAQLDGLIDLARRLCPALDGAEVIDRWAGLRPRAKSRAPLIGAWPGRPGQFVANGGFKIGFGMAPAVAGMIADLVLDGHDRVPAAFRP